MSILVKKVLENKYEVIITKHNVSKHIVTFSDNFYESLTNEIISKKKLLEYSFEFLLQRESNTSILSFFDLQIISKYFPEYEDHIKNRIE